MSLGKILYIVVVIHKNIRFLSPKNAPWTVQQDT